MHKGKRVREWEQVAKICQVVIYPHMSADARRKMPPLQFLPNDLLPVERSVGMKPGELRAMKGAFKRVETIQASDIRCKHHGG